TFQTALANAFLYRDVVVAWCGSVCQPDIVAELADFFVRFDQVDWALAAGLSDHALKLSLRVTSLGEQSGDVLREVVQGMGNAGGHDRRAGGAIPLTDTSPEAIEDVLRIVRHRLLERLDVDEQNGCRLLEACPMIPAP
ncbi:MAG: DHH family phosphoesterase, partial [Isosphaeraceae bacterium]